jgi:hypothetical protein
LDVYKPLIFSNTISAMQAILAFCDDSALVLAAPALVFCFRF